MSNADILASAFYKGLVDIYNSTAFSVFKFIIGIYVIVLVLDLILLLFQRGISEDIRITWFGSDVPLELMARRTYLKKEWRKIKKSLDGNDENKYKLAIIKADAIIEEILDKLKYGGKDFSEKVASIPVGQVEHTDDIIKAHEVRNAIVHDENFKVDKKLAEETMALYEKFLAFFGISN